MNIVCLDLEGVFVPEIWVEFAKETGIEELKRTTQHEPDYDKLMEYRIRILNERGYGIKEIQETIEKIEPFDGAKDFLDALREKVQVIILSDTFMEFCKPLIKKLGMPTIFCNSLEIDTDGKLVKHIMRVKDSKLTTVRCLQQAGFTTIAAGDSYNDIGMIGASKAGFLFRAPKQIKEEHPEIMAMEEYDELFAEIMKHVK